MRASRSLHRPWLYAPQTAGGLPRVPRASPAARPAEFFLACRREDDAIVGFLNLSEIVRGSFQSAYLGYGAVASVRRPGLHDGRPAAPARRGVRPAPPAPRGGEHPAREHRLDRARTTGRVPARRPLAALPEDRGTLARPRALGDPAARTGERGGADPRRRLSAPCGWPRSARAWPSLERPAMPCSRASAYSCWLLRSSRARPAPRAARAPELGEGASGALGGEHVRALLPRRRLGLLDVGACGLELCLGRHRAPPGYPSPPSAPVSPFDTSGSTPPT